MMTKFHKLEYQCYKPNQTNLPVLRVTPAVDYSDNNLNLGGLSFGLFTFVLFSWRPGFEASGFSKNFFAWPSLHPIFREKTNCK